MNKLKFLNITLIVVALICGGMYWKAYNKKMEVPFAKEIKAAKESKINPNKAPAALDATRLHRALTTGDYSAIRYRLWPEDILKVNKITEAQLKAVFDNYIFPEFAPYKGGETFNDDIVKNKVNVFYFVKSNKGVVKNLPFTYAVDKDKAYIGFQPLLVITHAMRDYRLNGLMRPNIQGRKDVPILEKCGMMGTGTQVGEYRTWKVIFDNFDSFLAAKVAKINEAKKAYQK